MAGRVVLDEIVEKFILDYAEYEKGAKHVIDADKKVDDAIKKRKSKGKGSSFIDDLKSEAEGFGRVTSALAAPVAGIAAGVAAMGYGAKKAFEEFASFDSMTKALEAVEHSAKQAALSMKDLFEIAKAPGIGFAESVQAYVRLRNGGVGGSFAKSLIKETANANALGGGSVESFERAMLAIGQMAMKPFLQGEELLQLMEANIPAGRFVKDRFGTADTEELKKRGITSEQVLQGLLEEMQKLPRVAGGAQNSIDNFLSSIQMMAVGIGGAIAGPLMTTLDSLSGAVEKANEAGLFASAVTTFADSMGLAGVNAEFASGALIDLLATFMTLGDQMSIFKGNLEGFTDVVKGIIRLMNWLPGNWLINKFNKAISGFDIVAWASGSNGSDSGFNPSENFENHKNELEMQMKNAAMKRAKDAGKKIGEEATKPKPEEQPGLEASKSNGYLSRIASNTDRLNQIADSVLGGGNMARRGFSREELGAIGRGSHGGGVRSVLMYLADLIEGGTIATVGSNVSRREV